jgi:peptidoglycan/LPS O-acetylase OafA/YrhL
MTHPQGLSSPHTKLAGLDHLRTIAISLVFLFHYRMFAHPDWIDSAGAFGWTGVDLFFVLSGYLIASQLFATVAKGQPLSLKEFFTKRFFRIVPAYAFIVAIYFFVPAFREWGQLPSWWRFATFTQNFGLDLSKTRTFSHAWSLCVEEHFYLLLPLIIAACLYFKAGKKAVWIIISLFIAGFICRLISWYTMVEPMSASGRFGVEWYKWIYYPTYNRLDGLLTGVGIAGLFQFYPDIRERITRHGNLLLLAGLVLITGCYFLCEDEFSFAASIAGFPAVAIAYGCLVMAAVSPTCILYKFKSRVSSSIATLSYSTYLSHKGIVHLAQEYGGRLGLTTDSNIVFVVCIIASLLAALLMRYIIEKPFLRIRNRFIAG